MNKSSDSSSFHESSDFSSESSEEEGAVKKNTTSKSRKQVEKNNDVLSKETTEIYKQKTHFVTRGWETYDLLLSDIAMKEAKIFLKETKDKVFTEDKKKNCTIFHKEYVESVEEKEKSEKRFQYIFDKKKELEGLRWFKEFRENLNRFLLQKGDGCILQECTLLFSEEGCEKQQNHRDYSVFDSHYMAGIFSFDDKSDTYLNIEDNDTVKPEDTTEGSYSDQTTRVKIPVGQVLLFRGDTIHSGSAYEENSNLRIYFKSYPNGVKLPEDNKRYVNLNVNSKKKELVHCPRCQQKIFKNQHAVYKHQRTDCPAVSKEEKEKKKQKHLLNDRKRKRNQRENNRRKLQQARKDLEEKASGIGLNDPTQEEHTTSRITRSMSSKMNL